MSAPTSDTPTPSPDQGSLELTEEYIRIRAYHRWEQRGREHGHDTEDWLEAEAEIEGKKQPHKIAPNTSRIGKGASAG